MLLMKLITPTTADTMRIAKFFLMMPMMSTLATEIACWARTAMATTTSAPHPLLPSVELSLLNSYVLMLLGMPSSMRDLEVLLFAQDCFSVLASCSTDVLDPAGSRRVSTLLGLLELRLRRPSLSRRHLLLPSRPLLMQLQLLSRRGLLHRLLRSFISLISLRRLRRRSR